VADYCALQLATEGRLPQVPEALPGLSDTDFGMGITAAIALGPSRLEDSCSTTSMPWESALRGFDDAAPQTDRRGWLPA
jgi:hypothetical protein